MRRERIYFVTYPLLPDRPVPPFLLFNFSSSPGRLHVSSLLHLFPFWLYYLLSTFFFFFAPFILFSFVSVRSLLSISLLLYLILFFVDTEISSMFVLFLFPSYFSCFPLPVSFSFFPSFLSMSSPLYHLPLLVFFPSLMRKLSWCVFTPARTAKWGKLTSLESINVWVIKRLYKRYWWELLIGKVWGRALYPSYNQFGRKIGCTATFIFVLFKDFMKALKIFSSPILK